MFCLRGGLRREYDPPYYGGCQYDPWLGEGGGCTCVPTAVVEMWGWWVGGWWWGGWWGGKESTPNDVPFHLYTCLNHDAARFLPALESGTETVPG